MDPFLWMGCNHQWKSETHVVNGFAHIRFSNRLELCSIYDPKFDDTVPSSRDQECLVEMIEAKHVFTSLWVLPNNLRLTIKVPSLDGSIGHCHEYHIWTLLLYLLISKHRWSLWLLGWGLPTYAQDWGTSLAINLRLNTWGFWHSIFCWCLIRLLPLCSVNLNLTIPAWASD